MAHSHCGCKHNLRHCEHCDVVYCVRCGKEWCINYITTSYPCYTYTNAGTPVQFSNPSSSELTISNASSEVKLCKHKKK